MGISIDFKSYEKAAEELDNATKPITDAGDCISSGIANVDSQVMAKVSGMVGDLRRLLDDCGYEIKKITNDVINKVDSFKDIEKKYTISNRIGIDTAMTVGTAIFSSISPLLPNNGLMTDSNLTNDERKTLVSNEFLAKLIGADVSNAESMADIESLNEKLYKVVKNVSLTIEATGATTSSHSDSLLGDKGYDDSTFFGGMRSVGEDIWTGVKKTGASVGNGVVAFTQGVGEFGEALVDTAAIVGSGVCSLGTGAYDGYQAIRGSITGEEWSSVTKDMWGEVMGFVGTTHVKDAYADFHANTSIGKTLDEYAFSPFKSSGMGYKVIDGVGYVAGIVALTLGTAGLGTAATGAAGASSSVSSASLAVTAGTAGFGQGAEEAWSNGASLSEGLTYASANAVWEGVQFYLGSKISAADGFATDITKSILKGGGTELENSVLRTTTAVLLDSVDSGAEGLVNPLLDSIYKKGYINDDGLFVQFTEQDSALKKFVELFDDNGGWKSVGAQAAFGGFTSLLGETIDLGKIFDSEPNDILDNIQFVEIDDDFVTDTIEDNSSVEKQSYSKEDVEVLVTEVKDFLSNLKEG